MSLIICRPGYRAVRKFHQKMSVRDREQGPEGGREAAAGKMPKEAKSTETNIPLKSTAQAEVSLPIPCHYLMLKEDENLGEKESRVSAVVTSQN